MRIEADFLHEYEVAGVAVTESVEQRGRENDVVRKYNDISPGTSDPAALAHPGSQALTNSENSETNITGRITMAETSAVEKSQGPDGFYYGAP